MNNNKILISAVVTAILAIAAYVVFKVPSKDDLFRSHDKLEKRIELIEQSRSNLVSRPVFEAMRTELRNLVSDTKEQVTLLRHDLQETNKKLDVFIMRQARSKDLSNHERR